MQPSSINLNNDLYTVMTDIDESPGKQADLVILDSNSLLTDPDTLKDIPVIETFARGQSIYRQR